MTRQPQVPGGALHPLLEPLNPLEILRGVKSNKEENKKKTGDVAVPQIGPQTTGESLSEPIGEAASGNILEDNSDPLANTQNSNG